VRQISQRLATQMWIYMFHSYHKYGSSFPMENHDQTANLKKDHSVSERSHFPPQALGMFGTRPQKVSGWGK